MKTERKDTDRNFTRRVTMDFTQALLTFLQEKSLESIRTTELCRYCHYPRSTFYNYYEDIYALMENCWELMAAEIQIDRFQKIPHEERTATLFAMLYAYMEQHQPLFEKLLKHNPVEGAMCRSLNAYMRRRIERMVAECPGSDGYPISLAVVAEHYSNTVWMLLERCFLVQNSLDRDSALQCLNYLLGTLEEENRRR